MSEKKYLRGFANFGMLPVTKNDADGYTVDDSKYLAVPGGQSCSKTDNRSDYTINADDGVWDDGSEWESTTLDVTVVETELSTMADMLGITLTGDDVMEEGTFDDPPERALSFSGLRKDGGYRLFRYYAAKCTGYDVSHTTKGQSTDAQAYTFHFKCTPRKSDGKIRATKDVDKGDSLNWLSQFTPASQTQTPEETPSSP